MIKLNLYRKWLRSIFLCVGLFCLYPIQAQIVNIEDVRADLTDTIAWYEQVDLNINLTDNGDRVFILKGNAQFEAQFKDRRFLSLTKYHLINAGKTEFINMGFQHLRLNLILNDRLEHEFFAQIQYNEQIKLKIRGLVGTGLRMALVDQKDHRGHLGGSYMYEYDEVKGDEPISRNSRLSTYLSYHWKISDKIRISNTTYYQPLFKNFNDYRLSTETLLVMDISKRLSFKSNFELLYDSRQAVGVQETIYSFSNGFRYRFK